MMPRCLFSVVALQTQLGKGEHEDMGAEGMLSVAAAQANVFQKMVITI